MVNKMLGMTGVGVPNAENAGVLAQRCITIDIHAEADRAARNGYPIVAS
jgi:hypothetical protein